MYPIIGYLGLLMLVVLVVASYRKKGGIRKEKEIRNHLLGIVEKAYDSEQDLTSQDKEKAKSLYDERKSKYLACADIVIDGNKSAKIVASEIAKMFK